MIMDEPAQVKPKKINVPTQYREGAKILKQMVEEGKSLKNLVYNNQHLRISSMSKLMGLIQAHEQQLEEVIKKTEIFEKEKYLNPWLGRILISELLFGRKQLIGQSKPVQCVLSYQEELEKALASVEAKPKEQKLLKYNVPRYVRINTILMAYKDAIEYCEQEGWKLVSNEFDTYEEFLKAVQDLDDESFMIDYHMKELLIFPKSSKRYWSTNEMKNEGKFLLQDKASCLPPFMLDPAKKSVVLDMCSAPGNKTVQLAAIMKNKGKIYAVEKDADRFKLLCETIEASGVKICQTIHSDITSIGPEQTPKVEYILLDPSCSGSGMLNRFVQDTDNEKDSQRLYKLSGLQYKLLFHAMTNFPNVQRIVYSTCSIYPEENEEVVLGALRHCKDFKLINAKELLGGYWTHTGSEEAYPGIGSNVIYSKTEHDLSIGFFVAVFIRCDEGEENEFYKEKQASKRPFVKNKNAEEASKQNKYKKKKLQKEIETE
uniref:CSON001424 protein n=1 Tax=Culicoides sonorensis TaxID=179676 RepID=A0A336MU80_CULSO